MTLSDAEIRVLGALIEKARTTQDAYPLSTAALVAACNQRTNRDPVTDLHVRDVEAAADRLRDRGLAALVRSSGDRVPKHRHKVREAWSLNPHEEAVLAILMLRGPQTAAELRTRSERYGTVNDVGATETALASLAARPMPLVRRLPRRPGQSQDRYHHTLAHDPERLQPRARRHGEEGAAEAPAHTQGSERNATTVRDTSAYATAIGRLQERVRELESRVEALESVLRDAREA